MKLEIFTSLCWKYCVLVKQLALNLNLLTKVYNDKAGEAIRLYIFILDMSGSNLVGKNFKINVDFRTSGQTLR